MENKEIEPTSLPAAIQTERVFVWFRQNTQRKKTLIKKDRFFGIRFFRLRTNSARYLVANLWHKLFFNEKNSYFQRHYFFPIFISNGSVFIIILLIFFGLKNYYLIVFPAYAIIAIIAAGLIAGATTFTLQKHQDNEIEQFSQLSEFVEGQKAALRLKELFCTGTLKQAAIHLKKEVDLLNDLLSVTSVLLSLGVLLGSYGIMLDAFWESSSKSLISQETISKVVAGFVFLSGGYIRLFGYFRLRQLRQWQMILDLSQQ